MTAIAFTYWPRLTDPQGRRYRTTWTGLLDRLAKPRVEPVKDRVPGFALATFAGDRRALARVERVYAVTLDLDHLDALSVHTARPEPGVVLEPPDWDGLRRTFANACAFVHTTHSSTLQLPRLRVILLLSRPVTADEYRRVYRAVARTCEAGGLLVDRQASDPSRLWYLSSIPAPGGHFVFWTCNGPPIDVERALAAEPAPALQPPPPPPSGPVGDVEARAAAYLDRCAPAISGSGGHAHTFVIAQRLVRGFLLDESTAFRLLARWNLSCQPPWSEHELRRKLRQAAERGTMPEGSLLMRRA